MDAGFSAVSDNIYRELLDLMSKLSKNATPEEMLNGMVNATADAIVGISPRPDVTAQEFSDNLRMIVAQIVGSGQ